MSKQRRKSVGGNSGAVVANPNERIVKVDVEAAGEAANSKKKRRLDDYLEEKRYQEMLAEFDQDMYVYPDGDKR